MPLIVSHAAVSNSAGVSVTIPINFGVYNPLLKSSLNTMGQLSIRCTGDPIVYSISLSPGQSGTYSPRKMFNGHSAMNYNLYTNSLHTVIWGDGNQGTAVINSSLNCNASKNYNYPIYASIPGLQKQATPGEYSDIITVILTY